MQAGQPAPHDGLYLSDCACAHGVRLRQGATAPACPRCGGRVSWNLRSAFTLHPPREASGAPASPRRAALLVEDNPADVRLAQEHMRSRDFPAIDLDVAVRLEEAIERVKRREYSLVLLDLNLPDSHGLETVIRMMAAAPDVPIVVFTGLEDERLGLLAIQEGAQDYLIKGESTALSLRRSVEYAILRKDLASHDASRRPADTGEAPRP